MFLVEGEQAILQRCLDGSFPRLHGQPSACFLCQARLIQCGGKGLQRSTIIDCHSRRPRLAGEPVRHGLIEFPRCTPGFIVAQGHRVAKLPKPHLLLASDYPVGKTFPHRLMPPIGNGGTNIGLLQKRACGDGLSAFDQRRLAKSSRRAADRARSTTSLRPSLKSLWHARCCRRRNPAGFPQ